MIQRAACQVLSVGERVRLQRLYVYPSLSRATANSQAHNLAFRSVPSRLWMKVNNAEDLVRYNLDNANENDGLLDRCGNTEPSLERTRKA
jgi:hypothetical protein